MRDNCFSSAAPTVGDSERLSRRQALARTGLALGAVLTAPAVQAAATAEGNRSSFIFCLNTATIRGHKLGIVKEVELTAKAGYQAIEPWIDSIEAYVKSGGSLKDLRSRIHDLGITVESAIGFPEWIVDDEARRAKGVERAKYEMDLVSQLGGKRFAAPPAGATDANRLEVKTAAERYRVLLEAGDGIGVVPQLELWGFSKVLHFLGECVGAAMETGHPKACVLADVFHLYKGGSDYRGMRLLGLDAVQVLHMNDYPSEPSREKIDDSFRVMPGDGSAPLTELLGLLRASGGQKVLSVELFNRTYWSQDPGEVAQKGLEKMKAAVRKVV